MTHDPIDMLIAHNAWANEQVFARCRTLSEAELHQRFEIGLGSLHDTLLHNTAGYRWWTDRIADREPRPFLEAPSMRVSLAELERLTAEAQSDLNEVARLLKDSGRLNEVMISRMPPGKRFSRTTALMHCFTHAIHHRSQALNMLRRLRPGEAAPEIDLTVWQIESEG